MRSAIVSMKLDTTNEFLENNKSFVKFGASSYFKISAILLQDSLNITRSEVFYAKFKKYNAIINPNFDTVTLS